MSASVYAVTPAASAPPATTPLAMRKRRLVIVSTVVSSPVRLTDRVLRTDEADGEQPSRIGGGGDQGGPGPVGPAVHREQPGQRGQPYRHLAGGQTVPSGRARRPIQRGGGLTTLPVHGGGPTCRPRLT